MGILSNLFSEAGSKLVDSAMGGMDKLFTSDDERNQARVILEQSVNTMVVQMLDYAAKEEAERTARHQADMNSDSWLSKNIRPLTLVFLTLVFIVLIMFDSAGNATMSADDLINMKTAGIQVTVDTQRFFVKERWIDLLESLLISVYGFYFLSRGAQSVMQSYSKMKTEIATVSNTKVK